MALPRLSERIARKGSREIQALLLLAAQIRYGALGSDGFQCLAQHALGSRCVTSPQVDCILSAGDEGRQGGSAHVNVPHLERSKVNGRCCLKTLESFVWGNELGLEHVVPFAIRGSPHRQCRGETSPHMG